MLLNTLQTKRLYRYCCANRVGIVAVNAYGDSLIHDALLAAREADAPLILEASLWQLQAKSFGYGDAMLGLKKYITDIALMSSHAAFQDVPVIFHIDHIPARQAVDILIQATSGLPYRVWDREMIVFPSSISFDALGVSDDENMQTVISVGRHAAGLGIPLSFEVEPGIEAEPTKPEEAVALLKAIDREVPGIVDLFAPAVGTLHGQTTVGANTTFNAALLGEVQDALQQALGRPIGMALHGSSGLSDEQLAAGVAQGVVKINTATMLYGVRARAASEYFNAHADEIAAGHKNMKEASKDTSVDSAVSASLSPVIAARMRVSNAAGHGKAALQYVLSGEA